VLITEVKTITCRNIFNPDHSFKIEIPSASGGLTDQ